jgi:hypothetical protein
MATTYYYEIQYQLGNDQNDWQLVDWIGANRYNSYVEVCTKARYLAANTMRILNINAYRIVEYKIVEETLKVFPIQKTPEKSKNLLNNLEMLVKRKDIHPVCKI